MSLLYRAMLGIGVCVLVGASHVATAAAITWDFTNGGGLGDKGAPLILGNGDVTVTATAWNYSPPAVGSSPSFQAAHLFQVTPSLQYPEGGLGVCSVSEVYNCSQNLSADYQIDNYGHDDYVLFVFSAPMDQFTVRIDPEINTIGGWDRDVSYWVGNVGDPSSFDLAGKGYSYLTGLGFSYGYSDGDKSLEARDISIFAPTSANAILFGPKLGGEGDLSDRFKITSVTASVPEPSSMLLLALGMGVIGLVSMRRNLVKG